MVRALSLSSLPLAHSSLFSVCAAKDFIRKILVVDPDKRYTAEQCLAHPWIKVGFVLSLLLPFCHSCFSLYLQSHDQPKKEVRRLETFSVKKFKEYTEKYKAQNAQPVGKE